MSILASRTILPLVGLALGTACSEPPTDLAPLATANGAGPPVIELASIDALPTNDVASLALSPDGRQLVVSAESDGRNQLWVQDLQTGAARPLPGTEEGFYPFWSPDSQHIGFYGNDQLLRLELATGAIQVLVPVATWGAGGSWGPDGNILYATHGGFQIKQIDAAAATPRQLISPRTRPGQAHVHPQFLPDGSHYLFFAAGIPGERGIYVGDLGSGQIQWLVDSEAAGVFALGRIFFLSNGTLMAQGFDTETLALTGTPEPIAENVPIGRRAAAALAATADRVIYRTGDAGSTRQLTWYDRAGNALGTVSEPLRTGAGAPSISPDGTRVVVNALVDGQGDIWTVDLASGAITVVENHPGNDSYPLWSFDSETVLFSSTGTFFYPMYRRSVNNDAEAIPVFPDIGLRHPMDWSRDGRLVLFRRNSPDLWAVAVDSLTEIPIVSSGTPVRWPQISADGRWIAYQAEVSGQSEIHLHGPIDPPAVGQMSGPVSIGGGAWVRWRADGRELYYAAPDGTLMAVALEFADDGASFTAAPPVALFRAPMAVGPLNRSYAQQYMVADDGQRFLVVAAQPASSPVQVLGSGASDR